MELSDLLVSYKQVKAPKTPIPSIPIIQKPVTYYNETSTQEEPSKVSKQEKPSKFSKQEEPKTTSYSISLPENIPGIRGSAEFEQAYNEVEKMNPEAKKYRAFLTKMAQQESGFNKSIQNRAGAPAYGYFQFMQDGKKYNNISTFAGTDIETFRKNPKLQIQAAIKLAKSFEGGFSEEDKRMAQQKGFTPFGLLGGAWLGGVGGVRKYLKGLGNPSDKHWSKEGRGVTIADRIKMFNFKYGGKINY